MRTENCPIGGYANGLTVYEVEEVSGLTQIGLTPIHPNFLSFLIFPICNGSEVLVVDIKMSPPLSPPLKPIHLQKCETREHCVLSVFSSFPASRDPSFQNKTVSQTNFYQN